MRFVIATVIALSTFSATASEVIWSSTKIVSLNKELNEKDIILKRKLLRDIKINREDLGRPTSLFYLSNGVVKKDFQTFSNNCYTISFKPSFISAASVKCNSNKTYTIEYKNEVFESVTEFDPKAPLVKFKENSFSKNLEGNHHIFSDLPYYTRIEMPFSVIEAKVTEQRVFGFKKNSVELKTNLSVSRSSYAFLTSRTDTFNQVLKFDPSFGDMVFKSGNRYLLLKRFQPSPLTITLLSMTESYVKYLENIETKLYPYKGTKRCFRDDLYASKPQPYDCDKLIFNDVAMRMYTHFDLVLIDVDAAEFEVIKL
jgi:hypothetical protein